MVAQIFLGCTKENDSAVVSSNEPIVDIRDKFIGQYEVEVKYRNDTMKIGDESLEDTSFTFNTILTISKFNPVNIQNKNCTLPLPQTISTRIDIIYSEDLKSRNLKAIYNGFCVSLHGYIHPNISENGAITYSEFKYDTYLNGDSEHYHGSFWGNITSNHVTLGDSIFIEYGEWYFTSDSAGEWFYEIKGVPKK